MPSFNKVILIGNMTADPELKQTAGGTSVCSFSIAVNRRFTTDGAQNVDFINIVTWRQQAEFVSRYFNKGKPILVCGQLQTRNYTDAQGNKRYVTEVVADEVTFVSSAQDDGAQPASEPSVSVPPNPTQWGKNSAYTPDAYKQNSMSFRAPASQQFEEIPNDGDLPF